MVGARLRREPRVGRIDEQLQRILDPRQRVHGDIECGIGCGVELMSVVKMGSDFPAKEFLRKEFRANFPFQLVPQVY